MGLRTLGVDVWRLIPCIDQHSDTQRRILPDAAAVYCLLGKLYQNMNDQKKAVEAYVAAVKINPFLWEAFTGLCDTGKLRVPYGIPVQIAKSN